MLKRLDKALADGDNIRSVIRATGANSDGYTQGGKNYPLLQLVEVEQVLIIHLVQ